MARGDWNISVSPPDADAVFSNIILAPLMGWDTECYRLGYGGGHFNRTLAALSPRSYTIGVGFQTARLATICPQPDDIALDAIINEHDVQFSRAPGDR